MVENHYVLIALVLQHEKDPCWGLNVCIPVNSNVGILPPRMMKLLIIGTSKLVRKGQAEAKSLPYQPEETATY